MALLKKSPTEPFVVPSLADADPEGYGTLQAKQTELTERHTVAVREQRQAQAEFDAEPEPRVRPGVAELLGEGISPKVAKRERLRELKRLVADIEAAQTILRERLTQAHAVANRKALEIVRSEFRRRMDTMVAAMRALDEAHRDFDNLWRDLESEDIRPASLGPRPHFLGSSSEADRRIASFLKEAGHG